MGQEEFENRIRNKWLKSQRKNKKKARRYFKWKKNK